MSNSPFDEFKEIEKMFRRALEDAEVSMMGSGYSVGIQKRGDKTKVNVQGDVSEADVERLKKKYPDAEIVVNGQKVRGSGPVEVVDDEEIQGETEGEDSDKSEIEVLEEDEIEPTELALKRFKEKKKKDE